jgi:NADP-dependent 3-hydroxy acid dehydrogenase YdfG
MSDQSIIITGASSGIGRATAVAIADRGDLLVLSGRAEDRLVITRQEVVLAGGKASCVDGDLLEQETIKSLISTATENRVLHGLVLAAGAATVGKIHDSKVADWEDTIQQTLTMNYRLVQAALPALRSSGRGQVVFLNSVAGRQIFQGSSAYVAAKHGLKAFADTLREEEREHGIGVTSIFPGATNTRWWNNMVGEYPLEDMLSAEDVANAVSFALDGPGNGVIEELVIRHRKGDF